MIEKVIDSLNDAWKRDPMAIMLMLRNHVECNADFADHPTIQVQADPLLKGQFTVGALGFINGVLADLGQPLIASKWSEETDEDGRRTFLGFCEYIKPEVK